MNLNTTQNTSRFLFNSVVTHTCIFEIVFLLLVYFTSFFFSFQFAYFIMENINLVISEYLLLQKNNRLLSFTTIGLRNDIECICRPNCNFVRVILKLKLNDRRCYYSNIFQIYWWSRNIFISYHYHKIFLP